VSARTKDVYGSSVHSVDELHDAVSAALGVTFVPRQGEYHGGEYWAVTTDEGLELSIERNELAMFSPVEWSEEEFPEVDTVLYVRGEASFDEILITLEQIGGLRHLYRRCVLDPHDPVPPESQRTDLDVRVFRLGRG
jgi:hypothetical protein